MKCPLCPYRARVDKKTLFRQDHHGPRVAQLFVDHVRKRHTGMVLAESYFTRRCGLCGVTFYTASECVRHWEDAGGLAEHILEWRLKWATAAADSAGFVTACTQAPSALPTT